VLQTYSQALQLERNAERGRAVFDQQCAKCHRLGDRGYEVGPDLLTARTRADETLLADVLDPSAQITVGYQQYHIVTVAGRIHAGVLAAETATSVTLRAEEQKDTLILRQDIDEFAASTISMMPEGLEKEVSVQDMADLLGFLRQTIGTAHGDLVTLFDDDPGFAELLNEGAGQTRVEWEDRYQGHLCLAVSPPQRFSPRIAGWEYEIRERPEPGQFRYLRFAWKQATGDGVMIELAAAGRWPAADESRLRYFSGRNTTGWNAVEIAPQPPRDWTLVTRDLWREFGDFTLTGLAPTAMGGEAVFDQIQLLRAADSEPGSAGGAATKQ
jgi:putative heme-binding domain-containing protein